LANVKAVRAAHLPASQRVSHETMLSLHERDLIHERQAKNVGKINP
jgi:hypothetical protein